MATGASAAVPPVPGLKDTPHLTNSNFWNLEELPPRMGVIGAGPIGLEMSQAMQRFGCKVGICLYLAERGRLVGSWLDVSSECSVFRPILFGGVSTVRWPWTCYKLA